jgi:hypothetical protein
METNQNNADYHEVGPVYSGRGLGRYTGLDKGYICRAICDYIDEAIVVDIP